MEKHVRELSLALAAAGHEVVLIGPAAFLATVPDHLDVPPMQRMAIPAHLSRFNPWLMFKVLLLLRKARCDIVHAHASKAAALLASVQRWIGAPTLATVHSVKRNLKPYRGMTHLIAVSKQVASAFTAERCSVVYNGIAQPLPAVLNLHEQFGVPEGMPVIISVGRLVEAKGFDVLLQAIDGLPVCLLIAGEGALRRSLLQRIRVLQSPTYCQLLGQRSDVTAILAAVDAVVIASRREGFSYVLNEALLCGARVLSTDVPVANEVLPAALIVPINDAAALRARLQHWLARPDVWQQQMQGAHAYAQQHMTLESMTKATIAVYQRLLQP
ncbi:glycosyltransferase [Pseudomethylobacillus aquaticus]|nr:glycosyltransferase [Pseudomethylobacillus aquaticus]